MMNMSPSISVVIPVYNRKKLVIEAIRSVLEQKPKNYEVIVIDDGSTDGTLEDLKQISFPIRSIRIPHRGVSAARNQGIKNAKGMFIAFLDSDDLWLPGKLDAQLFYLRTHPSIPLVYVDQFLEIKGRRIAVTRFEVMDTTHEQKTKFDLPGFAQSPPIHISSVMVRKSIFEEVGYFNEDLLIHEDTDMWNRISEHYSFGYINTPLAVFRWEKDKRHLLEYSKQKLFISEGKKYMKLYEQRAKKRGITQRIRKGINDSYRKMKQLETLVALREKGIISEDEFEARRQRISTE